MSCKKWRIRQEFNIHVLTHTSAIRDNPDYEGYQKPGRRWVEQSHESRVTGWNRAKFVRACVKKVLRFINALLCLIRSSQNATTYLLTYDSRRLISQYSV